MKLILSVEISTILINIQPLTLSLSLSLSLSLANADLLPVSLERAHSSHILI